MFPQGQIVTEDETGLLDGASSIMVMWNDWAEFYARKLIRGDFNDPVLSCQLREGFSYCGVMPDYIPGFSHRYP